MFSCKPDYEAAQKRINAFWNHEDADRPLLLMSYPKKGAKVFPEKKYASCEEQWLDFEYRVEQTRHMMENTIFCAESMPVIMPNLGPEIISAFAGCPYFYGKDTTWTEPCLTDWEDDNAIMDLNHPLAKKLELFTKLLLEMAKGSFIVGLTDFHPGGDHVAALRDPQTLALDLVEYPDFVKRKLESSYKEYYAIYDYYTTLLKNAGMPIASWLPLTSESTMYIPSNDFSCMISKDMFDEFFLEGIREECRHYGNSIYHLDGPGALHHLDSLLSIKELDAVQWVPGAGNDQCTGWLDLFKTILAAGKSVMTYPQSKEDILVLKETLPAKGLGLTLGFGINNEDEANDIMKLLENWPK